MQLTKESVQSALQSPLPGLPAQLLMAPLPEGESGRTIPAPPPGVRKSAVLLLLSNNVDSGLTELTLTLRSSRLLSHSGQLSLPGGRIERDETIEMAALRETREEIGISEESPHVLGELTSLHVPHSGNLIFPVVGWIDAMPPLRLEPFEVSEAFQVPLSYLYEPGRKYVEDWNLRGQTYHVPYWKVHHSVPLWGATAMILSEFMALTQRITDHQGLSDSTA